MTGGGTERDSELRQQIELALSASNDELLAVIGKSTERGTLGAVPKSIPELAQLGRNWLLSQHSTLRDLVCPRRIMHSIANQSGDDLVSIVLMLVDLVAATYGRIPGVFVATVIARRGLREFCENCDSNPPTNS